MFRINESGRYNRQNGHLRFMLTPLGLCTFLRGRERVLFIGTRFSNLYTAVDTQYGHEELINSVEYLPKSHQEQNWPSLKEEPGGHGSYTHLYNLSSSHGRVVSSWRSSLQHKQSGSPSAYPQCKLGGASVHDSARARTRLQQCQAQTHQPTHPHATFHLKYRNTRSSFS